MLLGTLGATLLGNMLESKRVIRAGEGIELAMDLRDLYFFLNFDSTPSINKL